MDKLKEEELSETEQISDIVNILQYIAEYPKGEDPVKRSDSFRAIQVHAERTLKHLGNRRLILG